MNSKLLIFLFGNRQTVVLNNHKKGRYSAKKTVDHNQLQGKTAALLQMCQLGNKRLYSWSFKSSVFSRFVQFK